MVFVFNLTYLICKDVYVNNQLPKFLKGNSQLSGASTIQFQPSTASCLPQCLTFTQILLSAPHCPKGPGI